MVSMLVRTILLISYLRQLFNRLPSLWKSIDCARLVRLIARTPVKETPGITLA